MTPEELAALILRVILGGVMVAHGVNHWIGGGKVAGTARWFEGLGLRWGRAQAWASIVTEIGAGVLLVLGLLTPLACAAVVGVMVVAGTLAHRRNGFFVFKDGWEYVLVLAIGASVLALLDPGRLSLDHIMGLDLGSWRSFAVAVIGGLLAALGLVAVSWRPESSEKAAAKH